MHCQQRTAMVSNTAKSALSPAVLRLQLAEPAERLPGEGAWLPDDSLPVVDPVAPPLPGMLCAAVCPPADTSLRRASDLTAVVSASPALLRSTGLACTGWAVACPAELPPARLLAATPCALLAACMTSSVVSVMGPHASVDVTSACVSMHCSSGCTTVPQLAQLHGCAFLAFVCGHAGPGKLLNRAQPQSAGLCIAKCTDRASPQWLHLRPCNPSGDHLRAPCSVLPHQQTPLTVLQQRTRCAQQPGSG